MQSALEEKRQKAERAQKILQKSKEPTDDEIAVRVKSIVRAVETTRAPEPLKPLPEMPSEPEKPENGKKKSLCILPTNSRSIQRKRDALSGESMILSIKMRRMSRKI
jgi:hypothetical protein